MNLPKFNQTKKTTLHTSITAIENTSIVLKKLVDIYDNILSMGDFTNNIFLTIEPGTDNEEIISATGFTVNSDGTVLLDAGIIRGLAAKSPYGATGTARAHASGVIIMVSNQPQFYNSIMNYIVNNETDEVVAGKKTFSTVPDTPSAPIANDDLANKAYVDAAGIGAATSIQTVVTGKAGETIVDGNLIYFDTVTANAWMLCNATDASTVNNVQIGIAQGAGVAGNNIANGVMLRGVDDAQSGLVAGEIMYAGDVVGTIQNTPGTIEVTIGIVPAGETTKLYFSPRFNQQLTENQQDALVGTSGVPSLTNKFVTNDDTTTSSTGKVLRLDSVGKLPVVDGSKLTGIGKFNFGGDGSDGNVVISANTNLDALGLKYLIKNYNDLTIDAGITLGIINKHIVNGTVLHLKVLGNLILNGIINLASQGGGGGGGGAGANTGGAGSRGGDGGLGAFSLSHKITDHSSIDTMGSTQGIGGAGNVGSGSWGKSGSCYTSGWGSDYNIEPGITSGFFENTMMLFSIAGAGGGGGGGTGTLATNAFSGAGGPGGGGLLIEVKGNITFGISSVINLSGGNGLILNSVGGGAGAGGVGKIIYNGILTDNGLTKTVNGGGNGNGGDGVIFMIKLQ